MPIVNAVITPMTMAFDAIFADRITAETMEIAAVAAISAAGAITHGISCVNHARVCIFYPLSSLRRREIFKSSPIDRVLRQAPPPDDFSCRLLDRLF